MSFENNGFALGNDVAQSQGSDDWNPTLDDADSRTSSTNIVSPISDSGINMSMKSMKELMNMQRGEGMNPSNYLYNTYGKPSSSASGSSSTSATMTTPTFQNVFNNGFPMDISFSNMNASGFMDTSYQDLTSNEYMKSAAALQAAQQMFGNYNFTNPTTTTTAPTSVAPNALFQNNLQDISIDQAPYTSNRSPSPLFEVEADEISSPELTEIPHPRRRASESYSISSPQDGGSSKRRGYSMNIHQDRSRLDPGEKADRAAAAEGLNKGDKRRMQNKLAQRAFRARSKIVNKHAAGRLEDLEELTEQQSTRIGHLTELVGRLQKENYALKSSKFQEALMKGGMPQ